MEHKTLLSILALVLVACPMMPARADGTVPAAIAAGARTRPPYERRSYLRRCRTESRSVTPAAVTVEDRDEARRMAISAVESGRISETLLFARVLYGETGTPVPGTNDDEPLAILAVLDARRGRMSRAGMMARYSTRRLFPSPDDVRQRWIAELQLDGSRPPSWRLRADWRAYGCPRWLATVDVAKRVLRGHPSHVGPGPCDQTPHHWGGDMDSHRAERRGWRRVECGITRNTFWVVPGRRTSK